MSLQPGSGSGSDSGSEERKNSYQSGIDPEYDTLVKKTKENQVIPSKEELLEGIPEMRQRLRSESAYQQLEAMIHFRNLLGTVHTPQTIDKVINEEVVPRFLEFLEMYDRPELQREALWALINITSGKFQHTVVVVEDGAIPLLVKLLRLSNDDDVIEQAVWTLGNIACQSPNYRDLILDQGALLPLLSLLNPPPTILSLFRITTWTLASLVFGKPPVKFEQVEPMMPVLKTLIHMNDEEVVSDACLALYYLSDASADTIPAIIQAKVCPKLVELLLHSSDTVILPALRTLRNIVAGNDIQTQIVIDYEFLPRLRQLLIITQKSKKDIFRVACSAISNITAGSGAQIQAVIDAEIIPILVSSVPDRHADSDFGIEKEVARAIFNVTRGSNDQIKYLEGQGCIKLLSELTIHSNNEIVLICVKGLHNITEAQMSRLRS